MALSSDGPEKLLQHEGRSGSNAIGGNSSSTKRWNNVPRGTMDEVSSHVRLDLPTTAARSPQRLFRLVFGSHDGRALCADSVEKHEPASDVSIAAVDSLKALDPNRPIREADMRGGAVENELRHKFSTSNCDILLRPRGGLGARKAYKAERILCIHLRNSRRMAAVQLSRDGRPNSPNWQQLINSYCNGSAK